LSWLTRTLTSASGRKMLAALTGLALVLFLIIHLLGNLQIFSDSEAFNDYARALHAGPLIVIGDIGLLITFPLHIGLVIWLAADNRRARGDTRYKKSKSKRDGWARALASKSALYGGLLLIVFVVIHVAQFRLKHDEMGGEVREAVIATLSQPMWAIFYVVGSLVTGWHVLHGFQAAFRSIGYHHGRYTPLLVKLGTGLGILLGLGFASIPIWIIATQ